MLVFKSFAVIALEDGLRIEHLLVVIGDEHLRLRAICQDDAVVDNRAIMEGIDGRAVGDHRAVSTLDEGDFHASVFEIGADHVERVRLVG